MSIARRAKLVDINGNFSLYNNNTATLPDVVAPGQDIPLMYVTPSGSPIYFLSPGEPVTSWSSPYAVGIALLLKQVDPNLTPAQINSIEQSSGTPVTDPNTGVDIRQGVNINAAIAMTFAEMGGGNNSMSTATPLRLRRGSVAAVSNQTLLMNHDNWFHVRPLPRPRRFPWACNTAAQTHSRVSSSSIPAAMF